MSLKHGLRSDMKSVQLYTQKLEIAFRASDNGKHVPKAIVGEVVAEIRGTGKATVPVLFDLTAKTPRAADLRMFCEGLSATILTSIVEKHEASLEDDEQARV